MTTDLNTYGENIRSIQNQKAAATLTLAHLKEELHNTDLWKEIQAKELEIKELETKEEDIKSNILEGMIVNNLKVVEFTNQRFTAKQNPGSVKVLDENLIPQEYKRLKTELVVDKKAIKEAIQKGEVVDWAELSYGYSLVITPR